MNQTTYVIGIDPGTKTGFAVKKLISQKFITVSTMAIHEAMEAVKFYAETYEPGATVMVVVEDARQRQWIPKETGREVLQGVGSVKRDCSIWDDYLASLKIPYVMVRPIANRTKWSLERWQAVTGWTRRTSEHARDAAILVSGLNMVNVKTMKWKYYGS